MQESFEHLRGFRYLEEDGHRWLDPVVNQNAAQHCAGGAETQAEAKVPAYQSRR
jgi:hypothetical protein